MVNIYVDNNAWDILYTRGVDICLEFPADVFNLLITREAEFEIACIPSEALREYVSEAIRCRNIRTDRYFGFLNEALSLDEQRYGSFGAGRLADITEVEVLMNEADKVKSTKRPTGLFKNEADVSLAARSVHSVILTSDRRGVLGQIENKYAAIVVDLSQWPEESALADYVQGCVAVSRNCSGTSSHQGRNS